MTPEYRDRFEQFWTVLKKNRPIAFAESLAQITQHPKAAVLLSQLVYWTRHGSAIKSNNGWVHKTREQWWLETGLSREEQENARARLRELDLIEEWRGGQPAQLWFRLKPVRLAAALNELRSTALPSNLSFEFMRAEDQAMRDAIGPTLAYHRILAEVAGGVNAGLVLSRLVHLQRKALDQRNGLWFSIRAIDWERQFGLHRRQLENAKHKLCQKGLIDEFLTHDVRKRLYTQVNPAGLLEALKVVLSRPNDSVQSLNSLLERPVASPAVQSLSSQPVAESVNEAPATAQSQCFKVSGSVRNSPSKLSNPASDSGKDTLVEGGLGHGSRRETDIVYAQAQMTTGLFTTFTTTTAAVPSAKEMQSSGDVVGVVPINLIWPSFVTRADRGVIEKNFFAAVPETVKQEFLDEMSANHRKRHVENPVGYIRMLAARFNAGQWVPEKAHRERELRERLSAAPQHEEPVMVTEQPRDPGLAREVLARNMALLKGKGFKSPKV